MPIKDIDTQKKIKDPVLAAQYRSSAVHEIGNMILLNGRLNSAIRNYEITRKIDGEKAKKGIRYYDELLITKDFISTYDKKKSWDEKSIRDRTDKLTDDFLKIWPI